MALHAVAVWKRSPQDEHMESLRDLIRKLETCQGRRLGSSCGTGCATPSAELVDRIELFPDGLQDRILTGDAITGHQWESVNDLVADWDNIGPDPAIFKSKAEYDAVIGELASLQIAELPARASRRVSDPV
jgi:hypothetical protein